MFRVNPVLLDLIFSQLFGDSSTFRSSMKTLGREIVKQFYPTLDPEPPTAGGYNQLHYAEMVRDAVDALIENSKYLQDGKDDQVYSQRRASDVADHFII
jgi:hypothetical protein